MATITVIDRDGDAHTVEAEEGVPLMYTLRELDYGVAATCMGICSCATCHVYIDPKWTDLLGAPEPEEEDLVSALEHFQPNSRLSCQVECTPDLDGLTLTLAPEE